MKDDDVIAIRRPIVAWPQIRAMLGAQTMRSGVMLLLVGLAASAHGQPRPSSPTGTPRIVKFAGGQAAIQSKDGVDHVVLKDTQGRVRSESRCHPGSFDAYHALFKSLKQAAARRDRKSVIKLVTYPFRVNAQKNRVFANAASLSKEYDKVFTPEVLAKIGKAEPAAVMCRNEAAMLGDGVIWAKTSGRNATVFVLNQ